MDQKTVQTETDWNIFQISLENKLDLFQSGKKY